MKKSFKHTMIVVLFSFFLTFSLVNPGSLLAVAADKVSSPELTGAPYAILVDVNSGAVLFEKNAQERMVPSSMTKIMTEFIALQALKSGDITWDKTFPVSEKAWRMGGSKMFVNLGEEVPVRDLLNGIIVQSGNDACIVLAEGMFGDEAEFAQYMNKVAHDIGLTGSNFKNASGWPDPDHYMTAHDLAKLAYELMRRFPEYYYLNSVKEFQYNKIKQYNRNLLLGVEGVDGLKTGSTAAGGYGMVVTAQQNGRRLIAVVNGLKNEKERANEALKLIRYGFKTFNNKKIIEKDQVMAKVQVLYGKQPQLELVASDDLHAITSVMEQGQRETKLRLVYKEKVDAPIKKGDNLGQIIVQQPHISGQEQRINLLAKETVEKGGWLEIILQKIQIMVEKALKN